jgi:hypothetical protein
MSNGPPEANPRGSTGEKATRDASAATPASARPPITPVWPGSSLDWSSPRIAVQLYVELPFWLMMPEGQFEVLHGETKLKIEVVHGCEEIQLTTTHLKNRASTAFIAKPGEVPPPAAQQRVDQSKSGCSARIHRTTLVIETMVLRSALEGVMHEEPVKRAHAAQYLTALAAGHLPLVNALITAYRRVSYDPFVQEVTEATVPIWFVRFKDQFLRVSVYPYADLEYRLELATSEGKPEPANLATVEEVSQFLTQSETPGETILLDAWNYYYAGRYGDSIRALVSAIEVLLEAKYSEALRNSGKSTEQVRIALKATATKFITRLNNYLQLTKRTIPGPLLSWVPYITGVRLRSELVQTRELRHKIVHEGYRMRPFAHGSMLRAAETMTWLFDWLDDNEVNSMKRFKRHGIKGMLKGRILFDVEYAADGVKVVERHDIPPDDTEEFLAENMLWGTHRRALHGYAKDLPLFLKMSLAVILADNADIMDVFMSRKGTSIVDHEMLNLLPGITAERFRCDLDELRLAVFLVELDGMVTIPDLSGVMVRLLQLRCEYPDKKIHGLCVVNQQQHLAPEARETCRKLDDNLTELLRTCGLSLVFAPDLAWYIKGARDHKWPLSPLRDGMKGKGLITCWPPNCTYVGEVIRLFPKIGVLGVEIDADPPVAKGDQVFVHAAVGYEAMTVESIRQEEKDLQLVKTGQAGLKVTGDVKKVAEGAFVFRASLPTPPSASETSADAKTMNKTSDAPAPG